MRFIILLLLLFLFFMPWLINAVTHTQEDIYYLDSKYNRHSIEYIWSDKRINSLIQYQQKHCISNIGEWSIIINWRDYWCDKQTLTRTAENWAWGWWVVSPTRDYWICQLHYKYHKKFIESEKFEDPKEQIRYCQEVREDAMRKWTMPWYAYNKIYKVKHLFLIP